MTLVSHCQNGPNWGINSSSNYTPKEQYYDTYMAWVEGNTEFSHISILIRVTAVVERYDCDGYNDMPGLRYPVVYYEIGDEFSTYEPESVNFLPPRLC